MTVGKRDGASVPVWAAVTVLVSVLLAVGGLTVGAMSRASEADHRTIEANLATYSLLAKDVDARERQLESAVSALQAQYTILIDGQSRILQAIDEMRVRQ